MKIGFVGLGQMGWPMFTSLASTASPGSVIGFDCSQPRMAELRSTHEGTGTLATSIDELSEVDVLITMLPHGQAVQSVVLGENNDGLSEHLNEGTIVIDMSSSSPADTLFLYKALASKKIRLCDAPVSGSVAKARTSTLSIMLGCDSDLADLVKPILLRMGTAIVCTGDISTAHAMKALNNYVYAAGLLAASEALLIGEALGLDLEKLVDVLNSSSGRNVATETKLKQHMLAGGDFKAGFGLRLMAKDLGITHGLKESLGFLPPQLALCFKTWQDAAQKLPAQADNTEIMRYLKRELQPSPSRENT